MKRETILEACRLTAKDTADHYLKAKNYIVYAENCDHRIMTKSEAIGLSISMSLLGILGFIGGFAHEIWEQESRGEP